VLAVSWIFLHLLISLVIGPKYAAPYFLGPWERLFLFFFALLYGVLSPFAVGAVAHIWFNFHVSDRRARAVVLTLGICLITFVFVARLVVTYTLIRLPNSLITSVFQQGMTWFHLGGALIFLGTRK